MTESSPIRVLLVDDHAMVRRGLATFLMVYDDLELIGEAADGETAVSLCEQIQPDVILMDIVMPDMDGITATRIIRQKFPAIQVIALTSFKEEKLVQDALKAGAISYLLKDISGEKLAQAIRGAHIGHSTLSSEAAQALIQGTVQLEPLLGHDLTEREKAVLVLMVTGSNNSEIAEKLGVSPSTIKSHVSHVLDKMGVSSRTEAAALAVRHRLVA